MSKEAEESYKEYFGTHIISVIDKEAISFADHYFQYQLKKIMPSDEEIESYIEKYIEHNGYKMHDLSMHNECLTEQGVADCVDWLKEKLLKTIVK